MLTTTTIDVILNTSNNNTKIRIVLYHIYINTFKDIPIVCPKNTVSTQSLPSSD
jgi:hypothetical protein